MNTLQNIMSWYSSNCNGDWEHSFGVKIDTLDNPGWSIQIDILETELESKLFDGVDIQRSSNDWVYCTVSEGVFKGAGGMVNLDELLTIFLDWVERS